MKRYLCSLLLFLVVLCYGCAERGLRMETELSVCGFSENEGEYILECGENVLRFSKDGAVISLLRGDEIVLRTADFLEKSDFSGISFKSSDSYVSVKKGALLRKDDVKYIFALFDSAGNSIAELSISVKDDVFLLTLRKNSEYIKRYGFTFVLMDNAYHYGLGELTDENDIFRKLYHPTEQHFVLDYGSFERPYLQTDEGTDVITPVFFNSKGGFIFSDSYSYLDISFNRENNRLLKIHLVEEFGEESFSLALYCGENTRKAYEKWVRFNWQNRPELPLMSRPRDEIIERPIWTTWALYKWSIDEEKVIDFADAIIANGLPISYMEIDDRWTKRYGDLDFDTDKFPDPKGMIDYLHQRGIKVSLWVPPFVNTDANSFEEGINKKAFMSSYNSRYPSLVGWWNTANIPNAGIVDFFTVNGREWFSEKINYLIEKYGIDGFKYDAGEAQFVPLNPRLEKGFHPNMYSDYYARWGLHHRGVEMRSGYFAQNLPILFREFDKASHWGFNNGLASVMTQILAMGIVGYPFVLPDMIGGNEYLNKASEELFIRWTQLNSFLPYMQFSIPPFRDEYSEKVMDIIKKYLALREKIIPALIDASKEAALTQVPVVRPLFFEFEDDPESYSVEDEFMLTSKYLVAPVIIEGARSRRIYFPPAKFRSIHDPSELIEGPKIIEDYPSPLDIIPVFERVSPDS